MKKTQRKKRTNKKWWKQRQRALTRRNRRNKLLAVQRALRKNTNKVLRHIKPSQRNCKRRRVRKNKNGTWNKKDLAHNAACLKKYMIKDNPWMLESWAQKQARK
tara:strand:+ start:205 stop:516 length:312 start_codon:yes stop_codon:yes gene_type:complete